MKAQATPEKQAQRKAWMVTFAAIGFLALATVAAVYWIRAGLAPSPFTADETVIEKQVAGEKLRVPANALPNPAQRAESRLDALDVVVTWPDMAGYSKKNSHLFLNPANQAALIRMTFRKREQSGDMDGRLEDVYLPLLQGEPRQGPAGLTLQRLASGTGYDGEELAIYAGDDGIWVARCQTADTGAQARLCLRDVHVGKGLSLLYRFDASLLKDWKALERAVRKAANDWLSEG